MAAKKARKAKLPKAARHSAAKPRRRALQARQESKASKRKSRQKTRRKRAPRALEKQLRKTVAELGLTEARKIFASVEAAFDDQSQGSQ